tara:strand:- start:751 stop:1140 length:390 start_codon:yes stop_codon:yes gene_type:complete
MGRYYEGDISGKFWFGVQPSNDAEFFGAEGHIDFVDYYFTEEDKDNVQDGLDKCLKELGKNKAHLDIYFKEIDSYSYKDLIDYLESKTGSKYTEDELRDLLGWYARNHLGTKILGSINKTGECSFTAEL